MLLGHWLEMRSVRQASGALNEIAKLMPDKADRIQPDGSIAEVPVSELQSGDLVLIRPGSSVPADGVVVEGETQHAQMIIDATGQSILDISCRHNVPIINEIVGVRTWAQAEARCLGGENTRGWYAAEAAIETARVYQQL